MKIQPSSVKNITGKRVQVIYKKEKKGKFLQLIY